MTTNPVFDKNLECIGEYNPKLKKALLDMPYLEHDIQLVETDLKEPNLTYDGLPLHAQDGAENEAKEVFSKTENSKLSMHVVFGIGIGHLFKEFCERSMGAVFLYEPNLEILRVTLELVDFSKELSQPNVRVFSDLEDLKESFRLSYVYNAEVAFSSLGSYKRIYEGTVEAVFNQIQLTIGSCMVDYNTLKKELYRSIEMTLENLPYTLDETPLYQIKDSYRGKTALIVSAGPSLDSCYDTIKKYRDRVVIFCVGTAYKALAQNGIKPDFIDLIEINDCSGQIKGYDLSDINLILEPYTNTSIHKVEVKRKFLFPTNTAQANNYWARLTDVDVTPYFSKGNVSNEAMFSARMLGCSKIVLVGQDLAYVNNQCYSSDAAYSQLVFEVNPQTGKPEFKIKDMDKYIKSLLPIGTDTSEPWCREFAESKLKNLNETLAYVKGVQGDILPTQGGYAVFVEYFREFARLYGNEMVLINTSMIGAQIDGFENMSLEEAIGGTYIAQANSGETILPTYKYDKRKIIAKLSEDEKMLEDIKSQFMKTNEYMFKYKRELSRRKTVTTEANKYFKNLLGLYDKVTLEYYDQHPLYQAIAFNETIEIQYAIRATNQVDIERIKFVYSLLENYYYNVCTKIQHILEKIREKKGIINESFDSKG